MTVFERCQFSATNDSCICIALAYSIDAPRCTHIFHLTIIQKYRFLFIFSHLLADISLGNIVLKKKTTSRLNIYSVTLSSFFFFAHCDFRGRFGLVAANVYYMRGGVAQCRSFYMFSFIIKFILIVILFGTINRYRWAIYRVQRMWHIPVSSCFVFI